MDKKILRKVSEEHIEEILGRPPSALLTKGLALHVCLPIFFFFLILLGDGAFKGHNSWGVTINVENGFIELIGWLGFLFFSLTFLFMPLVEIANYFRSRKWYEVMRHRLASGEIYPDFWMPRKSLFVNFLLADKEKGKLYTGSDFREGLPLADLCELTCGFEDKKDYLILRFRSGNEPQKMIRTRNRDAAHQQIIRLQNFMGWK